MFLMRMSGNRKKRKGISIGYILLIAIFLLFAFWLNTQGVQDESLQSFVMQYGYVGVFFASILSGFNLIIPIPIISFFPFFVEIGLHPTMTVLLIAAGMTVGDCVGFLIGKGGSVLVDESNRVVRKLSTMQRKRPIVVPLFLFAYAGFAPLPNEVVVIPAALIGVRLRSVVIPVMLGNIVFNTLVAFGLVSIF
jgi:membrane protein YqaA with SNARE-associated domain